MIASIDAPHHYLLAPMEVKIIWKKNRTLLDAQAREFSEEQAKNVLNNIIQVESSQVADAADLKTYCSAYR